MNYRKYIHKDPILRQVILLTTIGTVGFVLNLFINYFLLKTSEKYSQEINNQLSKKELGVFLNNKITKIESNVKDLVSHQDERKTYFIKDEIDRNLEEIEKILHVLSRGGFYVTKLPVNFYQNNYINDTIHFEADDSKEYNINLIDISPKIIEIRNISKEITLLKVHLFESPEDEDILKKIDILKKEIETYMSRAFENSNRIFYETQLDYQSIKKKKNNAIKHLSRIKNIWMFFISIATLFVLLIIIRRILMIVDLKNRDQERLIKNKISIENILDTIPVGFIIFNQNYEVIKTNKQALNLFNTSNEEDLMKKTCKDIFTDQDVQICPFMTDSSKPVTNELKIKTINGEIKSVIKNATIIELDGEKVVLETFIDITKRKETEENLKLAKESAEMATHEKSKFLASMSHEIRTPLNGIIGMASMLQNTSLNDQQQNFLEIIQVSSNNLVSIISDILDFSKIEAGEIVIDKHSFNIARELDNNLKALHLKADEKGIKVNFHVLEEVPEYIFGDSVRIKQIFINLVSNAIKFTEKGQVDVFLSYNAKLTKFRVSVRDTGIGIPKNRLNSIFTAFSQTDGTITRKFGGTGLGLTISKELAELMQGRIGVDSTEGIGSEFWFEIPAKAGEKPKELEKTATPLIKSKEKLNILVAEDNKINQKVASVIFQKLGYQIDLAENGLEALEKFKNNLYHIIFMDIQMPMMDGITATEKILDWAKEQNHNVFITAMTANALKEDKQKCLNAGMKFFISKPIRPENIEESIEFYYKTNKV